MSGTWTIKVGSKVYGPYSTEQMRAFQVEGRLAAYTHVAPAGTEQFLPAAEFEELAPFFSVSAAAASSTDSSVQAPATQSVVATTAAPTPRPAPETRPAAEPRRFGGGHEAEHASGETTRFVIISDMRSGSISALEEEIFNLGVAFRFMPQAWVLTSEASLNTIRHALMQKLGKLDVIFIVDTVHDRAAWFNFGPEADIRVRRMWARLSDGARKAS